MKIGLILSHAGLAGLWTPGCQGGAILAAAELNVRGGVLGQEIELVHIDSGEGVDTAFLAARRLAIDERVDAVVGLQSSNLRSAVRRGLGGLAPYIYAAHYEGGYCGPGTASLGITDADVLNPGIAWLADSRRAQRFFFLGNDYIWPRVAHGTTEQAVARAGGKMVGGALLPLGHRDYAPVLDLIRRSRPDVVVIAMLGEDAVSFNRIFGEAQLSRSILRLALAFDETQLLGVAPENSENLFAAQPYFASSPTRDREAMAENYRSSFKSTHPGITANSVNFYDAIYLVSALAEQIGRIDGHLMALRLKTQMARVQSYAMIGRSSVEVGARLAEADGIEFVVRDMF